MAIADIFWEKCVENDVIIVAFIAYTKYDATGNLSEADKIGLRFVALKTMHGLRAQVAADFYLDIDDAASDPELIAETPAEALELYLKKAKK